ncbi:MAG: hypothetical protein R2911_23945 [Caldilineaceae bacterium]
MLSTIIQMGCTTSAKSAISSRDATHDDRITLMVRRRRMSTQC